MKEYKVTAKDVAYFRQRCRHWLKVLSLGDWRVDIYSEKLEGMSAGVELWWDSHAAHIKLNSVLGNQPDRAFLDRVALHESIHVLLSDYSELCKRRFTSEHEVSKIEHILIRRLETALTGRQ
jgi:hypothetical protein